MIRENKKVKLITLPNIMILNFKYLNLRYNFLKIIAKNCFTSFEYPPIAKISYPTQTIHDEINNTNLTPNLSVT